MRRGDVSRFDSSVNIELKEYRIIRKKVLAGDSLVTGLMIALRQNLDLIAEQNAKEATLIDINARNVATIADKDKTILDMRGNFDELEETAKKFRFFKKPWIDTTAKITLGVLIGGLIFK